MKKKYKNVTCPECNGEKYILAPDIRWKLCPTCGGAGAIKVEKTKKVRDDVETK